MVAHLTASAEEMKLPWGFPVRSIRGHRRYPEMSTLDARNQIQIDDLRQLTNGALVQRYCELRPAAVSGIRRTPTFLGRLKVPSGLPGVASISLGYLQNVICLRDVWMHGVDLTQATGRPRISGQHDEAVVAQVIRDLAIGWTGPPIELELTGAGGNRWRLGAGESPNHVVADAVQFCRLLAGRPADPLPELVSGDHGALAELRAARVLF
jgi:uncharacterized protein (TIGR03083 family)